MAEERWIVLFDSIHDVLAAERAFRHAGLFFDLVPVPRRLSADCGMAIEFRPAELPGVRGLLAEGGFRWKGVWQPTAEGYGPVAI